MRHLPLKSFRRLTMAVSFVTNSRVLANWGFSAGDIAAIVGTGRSIGTWVMAQMRDQTLLDFIKVDPDDLVPRKSMIDTIALHKRWDIALTLLQNGRKRTLTNLGTPLIEPMPKLSWFMVLVVSSLDAALQLADFRRVILRFLTTLLAEHLDSMDYVIRELPLHIQGWISAACVRNVSAKARSEWATLAERGVRNQGQIPSDDCPEVERLLIWLSGACGRLHERRFETASSDVYALAMVLQAIGFDLIATNNLEEEGDESDLWVMFNPSIVVAGRPVKLHTGIDTRRRGMRIPLDFMEECVSLWPSTVEENNFRRLLFTDGMRAGEDLRCVHGLSTGKESDVSYRIIDPAKASLGRVSDTPLFGVITSLLPLANSQIVDAMGSIMGRYPRWRDQQNPSKLDYLESDPSCLAEVQILVMGYYYALLKPLLDASQLTIKEAYGDWQWNDLNLLYRLNEILRTDSSQSHGSTKAYLSRTSIVKLLAILFAGAEEAQYKAINDSSIGVHGRITIVPMSMLGHADSIESVSRFCLLDFDSSAIPSNARGMILSGQPLQHIEVRTVPNKEKLCDIRGISATASLDEDFSSHIEPDWDNDVQSCQIVYRYKGRMVRRFSPLQIERSVSFLGSLVPVSGGPSELFHAMSLIESHDRVYLEGMESFFDRKTPIPSLDHSEKESVLLATRGCNKARACLQTLYTLQGFRLVANLNSWPAQDWLDHNHGSFVLYNSNARDSNQDTKEATGIIIA